MDEDINFTQHSASNVAIVWAAIASVGWYILAVAVALFCASPYIGEKYKSWRLKKDEEEYSAKYHKNPDLFEERLTKVEASRRRMQERYNELAEMAKKRNEERAELKRQQLFNLTNKLDGGNKLGSSDGASTSNPSSSKLRDEYNPLMGDNSRGYRPPKRNCCKKGGCG